MFYIVTECGDDYEDYPRNRFLVEGVFSPEPIVDAFKMDLYAYTTEFEKHRETFSEPDPPEPGKPKGLPWTFWHEYDEYKSWIEACRKVSERQEAHNATFNKPVPDLKARLIEADFTVHPYTEIGY